MTALRHRRPRPEPQPPTLIQRTTSGGLATMNAWPSGTEDLKRQEGQPSAGLADPVIAGQQVELVWVTIPSRQGMAL